MRSGLFEAQVVRKKLQETLTEYDGKAIITVGHQESDWEFAGITEQKKMHVMEEVLALCQKAQSQTKILSQLTATFGSTSRGFMRYMLSQGLISHRGAKYYITRKGQRLLTLLVKLHSFFGVNQPI